MHKTFLIILSLSEVAMSTDDNLYNTCITVPHVKVAIKKLKAAKCDCTDHLVSDRFING